MQDLEVAILELIKRIYCAEYHGCITVREIKDCICNTCCPNYEFTQVVGYELILGMHTPEKPLRLAINGTQEQFLKFIAKELRSRKLNLAKYFTGYMEDPDKNASCQVENTNTNCSNDLHE